MVTLLARRTRITVGDSQYNMNLLFEESYIQFTKSSISIIGCFKLRVLPRLIESVNTYDMTVYFP